MESKAWWQSKGVWGGVIAMLCGIANGFGIEIGLDDQMVLSETVVTMIGGLGGLLAIYGRVKAKSSIG